MIKNTNQNTEFTHFQDLSSEWWLENGKFKILHTITPLRIEYIKDKIGKNKNSFKNIDILDLGCGGGLTCEPLCRLKSNVTGIDFISNNIKVAKEHAKESKLKIKYINQDISSLHLTEKYDLILMLELVEHLDNWKLVIENSLQFLKPKGKIIISTINRTFFSNILAIHVAENILKWVPKKTHTFKKFIKPEELTEFLKRKKMKIIDTTGLIYNPISRNWNFNKKKIKYKLFLYCSKILICFFCRSPRQWNYRYFFFY